mmetsp:Transcript_12700/g.38265  ORF Transcript_12700/g.38265 Transcript_12700/m.38265 type:complete len:229 (-) Transcript_12700:165-851(-)
MAQPVRGGASEQREFSTFSATAAGPLFLLAGAETRLDGLRPVVEACPRPGAGVDIQPQRSPPELRGRLQLKRRLQRRYLLELHVRKALGTAEARGHSDLAHFAARGEELGNLSLSGVVWQVLHKKPALALQLVRGGRRRSFLRGLGGLYPEIPGLLPDPRAVQSQSLLPRSGRREGHVSEATQAAAVLPCWRPDIDDLATVAEELLDLRLGPDVRHAVHKDRAGGVGP